MQRLGTLDRMICPQMLQLYSLSNMDQLARCRSQKLCHAPQTHPCCLPTYLQIICPGLCPALFASLPDHCREGPAANMRAEPCCHKGSRLPGKAAGLVRSCSHLSSSKPGRGQPTAEMLLVRASIGWKAAQTLSGQCMACSGGLEEKEQLGKSFPSIKLMFTWRLMMHSSLAQAGSVEAAA